MRRIGKSKKRNSPRSGECWLDDVHNNNDMYWCKKTGSEYTLLDWVVQEGWDGIERETMEEDTSAHVMRQ